MNSEFDTQQRRDFNRVLDEVMMLYPPQMRCVQEHGRLGGEALFRLQQLFTPGGSLVELGGGIHCVLPALVRLGMRVTVVETFNRPYYKTTIYLQAIESLRQAGIHFVDADMLDYRWEGVADDSLSRISSFNCIEHLHHSPRRCLELAVQKLEPAGWLIVGVPNAVNLLKRLRVLRGQSNLASLNEFYYGDEVFTGHVREWTAEELRQLGRWLGLCRINVVGRNWFIYSKFPKVPRSLKLFADHVLRPRAGLCSNLTLIGEKPV